MGYNDCNAVKDSNAVKHKIDMATLTIRNIDDETKRLLRLRAAKHERSMEEEVRQILSAAVSEPQGMGRPLGELLVELSRPGVELPDLRDRAPHRPIKL